MASIVQFERPKPPPVKTSTAVDDLVIATRSLRVATDALIEIADVPGVAGERATQGLRDIKAVMVDGY